MRLSCFFILLLCLISLSGCGPVTPVIHEGDNQSNYKSIFNEEVPPDVEIVNSIYVTYDPSFRPGIVTTPDYEIELKTTRQWIEKKIKKFGLGKIERLQGLDGFNVKRRIKERGNEWFAPKDIEEYEIYGDRTEAMYNQMHVDKTPLSDNRFRVFFSKH